MLTSTCPALFSSLKFYSSASLTSLCRCPLQISNFPCQALSSLSSPFQICSSQSFSFYLRQLPSSLAHVKKEKILLTALFLWCLVPIHEQILTLLCFQNIPRVLNFSIYLLSPTSFKLPPSSSELLQHLPNRYPGLCIFLSILKYTTRVILLEHTGPALPLVRTLQRIQRTRQSPVRVSARACGIHITLMSLMPTALSPPSLPPTTWTTCSSWKAPVTLSPAFDLPGPSASAYLSFLFLFLFLSEPTLNILMVHSFHSLVFVVKWYFLWLPSHFV